jgi:hypothetical protein
MSTSFAVNLLSAIVLLLAAEVAQDVKSEETQASLIFKLNELVQIMINE